MATFFMNPRIDPDRHFDDGDQVTEPSDQITVLPDPADVFAVDQPWLARLLHPLVSIDLALVDPTWKGRVHLLSPVEPEEMVIGENTSEHHTDYTSGNWISFHVDDDGRFRFLGNRRFFELEDREASDPEGAATARLHELYAEADADYQATKIRYARAGLCYGTREDPTQARPGRAVPVIDQLGGEPGYGNWASEPPPAYVLDESDDLTAVLRLADGRPFTFVAATAGYPWRTQGADNILLFFEPETRTAVLTFDWT